MHRFAFPLLALAFVLATALAAPGLRLLAQEATPSPVPPPAASPTASSVAGGGLTIHVVDPERQASAPGGGSPWPPLAGACFAVYSAADEARREPIAGACSGADGVATVRGLSDGDYVLVQTTAPTGYRPSTVPTPFAMVFSQVYLMTVENLAFGTATFWALGEAGESLSGACVAISAATEAQPGAPAARACDADDGAADGATTVRYLATGEYTAVEVSAPAGYAPAPDQSFTVAAGSGHDFATTHQRLPVATTTSIEIVASTVLGEQLGGSCFRLSGPQKVGPVCDGDAGDTAPLEGQVRIDGLTAGEFTIQETTPPAGVVPAADLVVTVADGQIAQVVMLHAAVAATPEASTPADGGGAAGTLVVHKVDGAGIPLPGACFEVMATAPAPDGSFVGTGACDADDGLADGTTTVSDLPTGGDYILVEAATPPGYRSGPDMAIAVSAGQTVTVTVVNEPSTSAA
jgi:uncharacterized surface anchored protein